MPTMIRPSAKAVKIAYKIVGVPANIAYKPTKEEKRINNRLVFEETVRAR